MQISQDGNTEKGQTLITSLGLYAGSFTSLLDALIYNGINVNKIFFISTKGPKSVIKTVVFPKIETEIKYCPLYKNKNIQLMEPLWINSDDFRNIADIIEFQNSLTGIFNQCFESNEKIITSVTSGRKIMGNVIDRLSMLYNVNCTYFAGISQEFEDRIQKDCQSDKLSIEQCIEKITKRKNCFQDGKDCRSGIADFFMQYDNTNIDKVDFDFRLHVNPKYLYLLKVPFVDMTHLLHFSEALDKYEQTPDKIFSKGISNEEKPYFLEIGFFDSNGNVSEWGKAYRNILTPNSKIKEMLTKQNEILNKKNPLEKINFIGLWIGFFYSFIQIFLIKNPNCINISFIITIIVAFVFAVLNIYIFRRKQK